MRRAITTMPTLMAVVAVVTIIAAGTLDASAATSPPDLHPPHLERLAAASSGSASVGVDCLPFDVAPPELPTITLDPGLLATGDAISAVQTSLGAAGTDVGPVDAVYGPMTAAGVTSFLGTYVTGYPCASVEANQAEASIVALAGVQDQLSADAQAARAARVPPAVARQIQSQCAGDFSCFKACTLNVESGGNYAAVSGSGTYRGAWQFDQRTWDANAEASGHPELVGQDPAAATPAAQDAVAATTYQTRGNQAWGGRC